MKKLPKGADSSGEVYTEIFKKHGESGIAKTIQNIASSYKPRPGMENIVKEIAKNGHTQRLASNIGPNLLKILQNKFKKDHKNRMFDLIEPGKIVDYRISTTPISKPINQEFATTGKPKQQFYKEFNSIYNPSNSETIIFIDDKIENILSATKAGWVAIHFNHTSKNSVTKLKADLITLKVIY